MRPVRARPVLWVLCFFLLSCCLGPVQKTFAGQRSGGDVRSQPDISRILDDASSAGLEQIQLRVEQLQTGRASGYGESFYVNEDYTWKLTAAVLNGVSGLGGLDGASSSLKEAITEADKAARSFRQGTLTNQRGGELSAEASRRIHAIDSYVETARRLADVPGFDGGALYDRALFVGGALWILFSALRMSYIPLRMAKGENVPPTQAIHDAAKILFVLLAILFLKQFVIIGIGISDGIKMMIAGDSSGPSTFRIFHDIIDARFAMLGLDRAGFFERIFDFGSFLVAHLAGWITYYLATFVIWVLLVVGDVLMALSVLIGPSVMALSLLPSMEKYLGMWVKGYVTILFWGPLAAVYSILAILIMAIGMDTSLWAFCAISMAYVLGSAKLPNVAQGLSTSALVAVAVSTASLPATALGGGISRAVGNLES